MTDQLREKIIAYYTTYYRDECSLPDWEARAHARLAEEETEKVRMHTLVQDFGFDMRGKKHLLVGAGTGGLAVTLKNEYGAYPYGVEPETREHEIILLKCQEHDIDPTQFKLAYGEALPFENETFDFVHCFTVLEHVRDVEKCIDEMIRVVRPTGRIIINTPNYAYPYEKHYKIYFPTFLPKFLGYVYLFLLGKNRKFYASINTFTERDLNKIFVKKQGIRWYRIYDAKKREKGKVGFLVNYLFFKRFVYPQQNIVILKVLPE